MEKNILEKPNKRSMEIVNGVCVGCDQDISQQFCGCHEFNKAYDLWEAWHEQEIKKYKEHLAIKNEMIDECEQEMSKQSHSAQFRRVEMLEREVKSLKEELDGCCNYQLTKDLKQEVNELKAENKLLYDMVNEEIV